MSTFGEAEAAAVFEAIDTDSSGELSKSELQDYCTSNFINWVSVFDALGLESRISITSNGFMGAAAEGKLGMFAQTGDHGLSARNLSSAAGDGQEGVSALTFSQQASQCRQGGYIMIGDVACTIIAMNTTKPGKHAQSRTKFEGVGIFCEDKLQMIVKARDLVLVPNVSMHEYTVVDLDEDDIPGMTRALTLMDAEGSIRDSFMLSNGPADGLQLGNPHFTTVPSVIPTIITFMDERSECAVTVMKSVWKGQQAEMITAADQLPQ